MVTKESVMAGVTQYIEAECARKADSTGQFLAYFMLPSIPKLVRDYMGKAESSGLLCDLMTSDGLINIDEAEQRAASAMSKVGHIDMFGFRLNENDVHTLADYIRRA